jgi:hypothetical protein
MAFGDKPGVIATEAAQTAAHAAVAAAGKTGVKTSEFWVSIGAAIAGVVCVALIPTPFGAIAAGAIGYGAAKYAESRGNVKASLGTAALNALGAIAQQVPGPVGKVAAVAATAVAAAK